MASKNKSSMEDAITKFEDVINRSSLTDIFYINKILVSKNTKENTILIYTLNQIYKIILLSCMQIRMMK